jgi:hypothetical protein
MPYDLLTIDAVPEHLPSWPRKYFEPKGGNPFLFYVVFGEIDQSVPLSASHYRVAGVPDELEVVSYGPGSNPDGVHSFCEGYLWNNLKLTDPELAGKISRQKSCFVLRGDFRDPATLDYLRDTIGLITHFLDCGGVAVFDPHMFKWWSSENWRTQIFEPAAAVPRHHVIILTSNDENSTTWFHTRGLRKFGRPDISIPKVGGEWKEAAIELCNRFIEFQAFGGVIKEGKEIEMKNFPNGFRCHHRGDLDDPDFNNVHVSIDREI